MEEVQPTTWDVLKPLKSIVTNLAGCLSSIVARAFVPGFQLFNHPLWNMKGIIHFWREAVPPISRPSGKIPSLHHHLVYKRRSCSYHYK